MRYAEALNLIGGLSKPSKMPWWSWSLSASECETGGKLREIEGSTCSACYALKGHYMFPSVKNAHARRRAALDHPDFVTAFVLVLTTLAANARSRTPDFRWFDAGDLPDFQTLEKIVAIAKATPHINHWLPTRELKIVRQLKAIPDNLTIRISAPMIGQTVTPPPGMAWSGVGVPDIFKCPAPQNENKCGTCRHCWSKEPVSYDLH